MKNRFAQLMLAATTFLASSSALAAERSGFFELPSSLAPGTGNPNSSFNSAGSLPTFTNPAPGEYVVTFPGLANAFTIPGEGGNVQVSSRQAFVHCNPKSWLPVGYDLQVVVNCFNRYGFPNNSQFVVAYRQMVNPVNAPDTLRAYVWNSSGVSPSAHPAYSFNSMGAVNSIAHLGIGIYRVIMPQMYSTEKGGNVVVSAYGTENGQMRSCKVGSWFQQSGTTLGIDVRCFGPGGVPADSRFTAFYGLNTANKIGSSAYVWSENPASPPGFVPNTFYQAVLPNRSSDTAAYSPLLVALGNITVQRVNPGTPGIYTVTVPKLSAPGPTNVLVTAYGAENANHCWIVNSLPSGLNRNIFIGCGDRFGNLADTQFSLQFGTSQAF